MSKKEELFVGMIIGDGCITKYGNLSMVHSIAQKEYIYFKKDLLEQQGWTFRKDILRQKSGYENSKPCLTVSTKSSEFGKGMREYFYPNGTKIIPSDLKITPEMWSIIYQDDGRQNASNHYISWAGGIKHRVEKHWVNRYTLYTDCFSQEDINVLRDSLLSYGIESTISYSNKNHYPHVHIYRKESKINFRNLILPYMCPSMMYKLNLSPYITFNE